MILAVGALLRTLSVAWAQEAQPQGPTQPYRLTLREAVRLGLQANLSVLVAESKVKEAAGTRERRLANLLPKAHVDASDVFQKVNLATKGLHSPFIAPIVGPFNSYDLRLYVDQPVLDLQSYHGWKSGEEGERAARHDYQSSRDLVVRAIASLYLGAQSAEALVRSAETRVSISQALLKLANDQHDSGVATGLDVLRAKVQLANDRQTLLSARNTAQQKLLALARNIGLDLAKPLVLAEALAYEPVRPPDVGESVSAALSRRSDYLSLLRQRDQQVELQKASRARSWPKLSVSGNYGGNGRTFPSTASTGAFQGVLSVTVFDRDREGERAEIDARLQRLNSQIADLRAQIEEDIREALLTLESTGGEVKVADEGLDLSQQELELARVRFQAGATNNVEVVTAQENLIRAQENQVSALTRYVDAKIALANALGATEKDYERFLGR
ncbi:MAG: TolC family protein [Acidobacteriia bacterium]|nr:TolC family protein [Terriglobia bacterium]